jgi:hypothetical protein
MAAAITGSFKKRPLALAVGLAINVGGLIALAHM